MTLFSRLHTGSQPQTHWDKLLQKRKLPHYGFHGDYLDFSHVLHRYVKPNNGVLVVGCENSKFSEDLYDIGCTDINNIDISVASIKKLSAKNCSKRPQMSFIAMDTTALIYEDKNFDCVIDQGNLDSMMFTTGAEPDDAAVQRVDKMFREVARVLKTGGRYICISRSQEHVVKRLLEFFSEGWVVRIHKVEQTHEEEITGATNHSVVFVFILTKMLSLPGRDSVKVYEYVTDSGHSVRCDSTNDLLKFIKDCQQYTLIRQGLLSIQFEEQIQVDLWCSSNKSEPKYTLRVVDQQKNKANNGLFAIFIVPQGRETNWLFSTDDGCNHLAEGAGFERLVIVTLHRDHIYQGINEVKEEISTKAVELQQGGLPKGKWPVLTLRDSVGSRTVVYKDNSPLSGDFVVEEVEGDNGECIRRLVYLSSPSLAQTEVLLKSADSLRTPGKPKSQKQLKHSGGGPLLKPGKLVLDHTQLMFDFHKVMAASLSLIDGIEWNTLERETVNVLTVGLGGGALPMYLNTCLSPQISQDVVELDPKMFEIACKCFGFNHNEFTMPSTNISPIKVHIENGIDFIAKAAINGTKYNAVILDVDSKDVTIGMSSPPMEFITPEFLTSLRLILKDGGIFISNLCARNKDLESKAIFSICKEFETVLKIDVSDSINKIIVALPAGRSDVISSKNISMHLSEQHVLTPTAGPNTLYNTMKLRQLSKNLKQKINKFSCSMKHSSEPDMFDFICTTLNNCCVHFISDDIPSVET